MSETMDKIKNKGAELKGELKNKYENLKEDIRGEDYDEQIAFQRGQYQAAAGAVGTAVRDTRDLAAESISKAAFPIERKADGSVDTEAAEARGRIKDEAKRINKEERKGYNETLKSMRR